MADNIVESLFGPTPYQIQQLQNQNLGVAADKFASQDPFQRAAGQLYRGGGMLGGTAAEGMGYVNPMAQQAKLRESVMATGGDLSTSAGLKAKAEQFAAAGDQATAIKIIMLARKQEAEEMDMKLKQAHAKYYEQQGGKTTATAQSQLAAKQAIARNDAMKWALNAGYKGQDLLDFVEAQVQKVTDTWNATTGTTQSEPGQINISPMTAVSNNLEITQEDKDAMIQDAVSRGDVEAVARIQILPVVKTTPLPKSKAEVAGEVKLAETKAVNDPAALKGGAVAKAEGQELGASSGKAQVSLAGMNETVGEVKRNIKELLSHPGFESTVGFTLTPGMRFIEGSKEADFMKRLEQIQGGAFLKAYETLKGGGQITEVEGTKATNAMMRMSKSVSEKEFKLAADDFIKAIEVGMNKLKMQASLGVNPAAPSAFDADKEKRYQEWKARQLK